jgi:uncharacterized protein YbjT (DUF2867 family)
MPTDPSTKRVLVAGATGRLGIIASLLLERGHQVRAMSRDPGSSVAAGLRALGAQLVYGDFDDTGSIEAAAAGMDVVFATGTAHKAGPDGEVRHGRNLADAVLAAGVPHLVYASGDGAAPDSPLPLFRGKFKVEERIRALGIPHTVLAPVYLMENLFNPWNLPLLHAGVLPSPVPVERPLQQLAIADLAAFAVLVIEHPERFLERRIKLASDELDAEEAAEALRKVLDRPLTAEQIDLGGLPPALRALFDWLARVGHDVDIEALRRAHREVGWHRYEDWARAQRARFRETCAQPV